MSRQREGIIADLRILKSAIGSATARGEIAGLALAASQSICDRAIHELSEPAGDERLTREEAWQELREAIEAAEDRSDEGVGLYCVKGFWLAIPEDVDSQIGPDPIAALEALVEAAAPKPCACEGAKWATGHGQGWRKWFREDGEHMGMQAGAPCPTCKRIMPAAPVPDPEDMSEEEIEAELDAAKAEGVTWVAYRDLGGEVVTLVAGHEKIAVGLGDTRKAALRAAVRILREHLARWRA